jgi:nicotine oxidoreductase
MKKEIEALQSHNENIETVNLSERKVEIKLKKIKDLDEAWKRIHLLSKRLRDHAERNKDGEHINHKIFYLLHDPFTFVNAYAKISKNAGALTEGYNEDGMMRLFGLEQATKIANKIKTGKYNFKPSRRNWVPKPGRNKKRPVDVPTQEDRIVQEAIRGILEAIYEPEFINWGYECKNLANNFGMRPNKSTWSALDGIKNYSQRCTMIIEGDIVSAYNHVNHKILMSILSKRIKDKKFLKFIQQLLKSGVMDGKVFEHSIKGTPQGGIASPILFNIYLFGFDKFVYNDIIQPIINEGGKKDEIVSKEYNKIRRQLLKALTKLKELNNDTTPNKNQIKEALKEVRKLRATRNRTPYNDVTRLKRKAYYVRYVDDWILALTCNQREAENIKERIADFLKNQRDMELDSEKTKITRVLKGYKFLGFEIRMLTKNIKQRFTLQKTLKGPIRTLKTTTSRMITIEPDSERLLTKLKLNKFCDSKFNPIAKAGWLIFDEFEIVEKYQQTFRGIYNYYLACGKLTRLNRISYILQYSCARTLARRQNTSMKSIFAKYGKNLKITKEIKTIKKTTYRTIEFLTLTDLRKLNPNINDSVYANDPFRIRPYWRTKAKIYNECCLCGSTEQIALHHINSVKNLKKTKKKDPHQAIRSTLNRLQIPVCAKCHNDITHGKYNDSKKPIEFFNEFLAKL